MQHRVWWLADLRPFLGRVFQEYGVSWWDGLGVSWRSLCSDSVTLPPSAGAFSVLWSVEISFRTKGWRCPCSCSPHCPARGGTPGYCLCMSSWELCSDSQKLLFHKHQWESNSYIKQGREPLCGAERTVLLIRVWKCMKNCRSEMNLPE